MFNKISAKFMKESIDKLIESGMVPDPEEVMKKIANSFGPSVAINPGEILEMGAVRPFKGRPAIITDINDDQCQIQQNGIDLRLDEVQYAKGQTILSLDKNVREEVRCEFEELQPDSDDYFTLYEGTKYAFDFMEWIEVPENMCAYLFVRSSINRYSGDFMTGLWDSSFRGRLGGIFRPDTNVVIPKGYRVAQVVFLRADSYRPYDGQFQDQERQA